MVRHNVVLLFLLIACSSPILADDDEATVETERIVSDAFINDLMMIKLMI